MPAIEDYVSAGNTTVNDWFLLSRNNIYLKLSQVDFYSEIQALLGTGVTLGSVTEHTDVDTTGVASGDLLRYNGTNWVPSTNIGSITNASDVDTTGAVTGALLRFNGTNWVDTAVADYFENGGNAGGASRTLGNTDNFNLGFKTNNTERLRILDTGEVGIGSTTDNDIDDAQLFIQTTKTRTLILYKTNEPTLSFYANNDTSTKTETGRIQGLFTDNTAGAEYGRMVLSVMFGGSIIGGDGILTAGQYYDSVSAGYKNATGVVIRNDNAQSDPTAVLQVTADSSNFDGVASSDFKVVFFNAPALGTGGVLDCRANGWVLMPYIPTSSVGVPTGGIWNDSGTLKIV